MPGKIDSEDPLDKLFVKGGEINRTLLSEILIKYIRIDENANIIPLSRFYSETNKNKILIILLARKAISLKTGAAEEIAPKEILALVDMSEGSLRPTLRKLANDKIVEDSGSKYKVFSHAIERCSQLLKKLSPEDSFKVSEENNNPLRKGSMRHAVEEVLVEGLLDEQKNAREIYGLVQQRRPGTKYYPLYKVLLDLVQQKKLVREISGSTWAYKRAI